MIPNNDKPSFMDRGTIIAFALIMVFWFCWSKYMQTAYPEANAPVPAATASSPGGVATPGAAASAAATGAVTGQTTGSAVPGAATPVAGADSASGATGPTGETFSDFTDASWSFQVSSKGMGLRNIDVKSYQARNGEPILLAKIASDYPFSTGLVGTAAPLDFKIERPSPDTFVGHAIGPGGVRIEKTMKVNSLSYSMDVDVKVTSGNAVFAGLTTTLTDAVPEAPPSGFVAGILSGRSSYDHQEWFIRYEGSKKREAIARNKAVDLNAANVTIAGLTEHYFAIAVVDHSDLIPRFESRVPLGADKAVGQLIYQPPTRAETFSQRYVAFAGPKSYSLLSSIDENLSLLVDYGMFTVLARPILWLLRFLESLIGNWGFAIIALTIIVRLIVMPFNILSYKSMKVMQRIQPEMNRIRERYKDKPAEQKIQMNQEIMELMKRNKANPMGGCLPMLIQLPVFLALYAVLGQSIELYRAPFVGWIHDLSLRDPLFVLPVLMGATMFVNQKITPSTMDPQQAKVMMFMPLVFSVFMLGLPSGLTLYIFVSTLFGIIQQMIFTRDKGGVVSTTVAKA